MNEEKSLTKVVINWYPGHMAKTKRQIQELLSLIDLVFEIIDARIPFSSRIENIEEIIKNKPHIIVMTKSDLCDLQETLKWKNRYEEQGNKVVLVNLNDNNDYKKVLDITREISDEINLKRKEKGLKEKELKALVVGIPNVGKSTFINRLVGKKVANVGNRPGITTNLVWLKTNVNILLLDTPGILWPKIGDQEIALNLASMAAIKSEVVPIDEVAIHILRKLYHKYPDILKSRYGISSLNEDDWCEIYDSIGNKIGAIIKGGEIDYDRVSNTIINDVKNELIKGVTFDIFEG